MGLDKRSLDFAQAFRRSHCARDGHEHECVGTCTIAPGEVTLSCRLCGDDRTSPCDLVNRQGRENARRVLEAAGIHWSSLSPDAQADAGRAATQPK